jgi:hypothetical protein
MVLDLAAVWPSCVLPGGKRPSSPGPGSWATEHNTTLQETQQEIQQKGGQSPLETSPHPQPGPGLQCNPLRVPRPMWSSCLNQKDHAAQRALTWTRSGCLCHFPGCWRGGLHRVRMQSSSQQGEAAPGQPGPLRMEQDLRRPLVLGI